MAGEQSSGTFLSLPGETTELKERSAARIEALEQWPDAWHPSLPGSSVRDGQPLHRARVTVSWPMDNIGAVLKRSNLGFGDVVKCTVMLDNMADWPAFNKVYVTYFPDGKFPARSAFGADGLALDALLEVECWAYAGKR